MDTETIAREIVRIKNHLQELDEQAEEVGGTEVDEERSELLERMRHLQDQLAEHGSGGRAERDKPDDRLGTQQVRPA